jgi:glutamine amidotransferase
MMKLAVITSGGANFFSIEAVLQRLGVDYSLTCDPEVLAKADGAILPGVGAAKFAMAQLTEHGLVNPIRNYTKPLLGICLGMQLLYDYSEEGDVKCLSILPGKICHFPPTPGLSVPHMGWNNLTKLHDSPLLKHIDLRQDVYFVHSYYAPVTAATIAQCDYGLPFAAIVQLNNFYGMQFHPEKSGELGEKLITNFIEIVHGTLSSN